MSPGASPERRAVVRLPWDAKVTAVLKDGSQIFPVTLADTSPCGGRVRCEGEFPAAMTMIIDSSLQKHRVYPVWTQTISNRQETGFLTEEACLISRVRSGESEALQCLLSLHMQKLKTVIRAITRGRADHEDVLQDCLLKVIQHTDQLRPGHSFRAWLLQIATHEALKAIRKDKKRVRSMVQIADNGEEGEEADFIDPRGSPADVLESKELEAQFLATLGSLSDIYKSVFILRQVRELSMTEVAAELNIKIDTANTRLHRARMCLYEQLQEVCHKGPPMKSRSLLSSSRNKRGDLVSRVWLTTD